MSTTFIDSLPASAAPVVDDSDPYDVSPPSSGGRMRRLVRGRPEDPAWVRPGVWSLLTGTALLYIWGLGASGWANSF
ncbi:MAG TPA: hypothetical protein VHV76_15660, partial [Mycobacteriales bacterium]|nr:hypothetical protein [Mycobacteriales bacterium]